MRTAIECIRDFEHEQAKDITFGIVWKDTLEDKQIRYGFGWGYIVAFRNIIQMLEKAKGTSDDNQEGPCS